MCTLPKSNASGHIGDDPRSKWNHADLMNDNSAGKLNKVKVKILFNR